MTKLGNEHLGEALQLANRPFRGKWIVDPAKGVLNNSEIAGMFTMRGIVSKTGRPLSDGHISMLFRKNGYCDHRTPAELQAIKALKAKLDSRVASVQTEMPIHQKSDEPPTRVSGSALQEFVQIITSNFSNELKFKYVQRMMKDL